MFRAMFSLLNFALFDDEPTVKKKKKKKKNEIGVYRYWHSNSSY